MSSSPIGAGELSTAWLRELRGNTVESTGVAAMASATGARDGGSSAQSDSSELSPLAHLAGLLEELRESDPARYKEVTAKISANLRAAAHNGAEGADLLNRLAADFKAASESGAMPDLDDLAEAMRDCGLRSAGPDPVAIILQTLASAGIIPA